MNEHDLAAVRAFRSHQPVCVNGMAPLTKSDDSRGNLGTMAIGQDLMEGAKAAFAR